jgi:hypothetical protein
MRFLAGLVAVLVAPGLVAQTSDGSLNGFALDTTSAAIARATITLRNPATGDVRKAVTDDRGQFVFPALPPATYDLTAEAPGFKRAVRTGIVIEVQQAARIDPVLEVGSVTETVEVVAEAPQLQPSTSSLGQVVDNQKILDLPLEGRNTIELMTLTTGVTPLSGFGGLPALGNAYGQGNVSVGGAAGMTTSAVLDGAPSNGFLINAPAFVPSVDTVGEFKVQTNAFSAEFGRTAGGVINVSMKSGANAVHGGVFEFVRNKVLDANSFFNNSVGAAKAQFIYNLYGGTLGGPVWIPRVYNGKDRTFFFFSYEGFRQKQGLTPIRSVPSALQRAGDFSETRFQTGQAVTVYDPTTVHLVSGSTYARDPFPGNRLPASRIDPVAAKVLQYYPQSNITGAAITNARNFIGRAPAVTGNDQYNIKIDQNLFMRHRVFGRYSRNFTDRGAGQVFGDGNPFSGLNPTGGNVPIVIRNQQFVFRDAVTMGPALLGEFSLGVVRQFINKVPWSFGRPLTDLGFPESLASAMPEFYYPNFSFTNFDALQASNGDLIRRGDNTVSLNGSVTRIGGRGTLKVGGEYRLMRANDYQPPNAAGFSFDTAWTRQNPRVSANASGYDLATFLLGYVSGGTVASGPAMAIQSHYAGGYAQQDWRIGRRLTLNLGVRWEVETPRTERYNRLNWFDFTAASPVSDLTGVAGLRGGLQFAGVDGHGRRQMVIDGNNFAPRLGFAYALNNRTTVRGGYGLFYGSIGGSTLGNDLGNGGYSVSTSMLSTNDSYLTASATLANPFPNGVNRPVGSALGLATLVGQNLVTVDHQNHAGYVQQYNFNVQRMLPARFLIDVAYAGSHSVHIAGFREYNQLNPDYYTMQSALLVNVPNPYAKLAGSGSLSAATVSTAQTLRTYPQFLNVSVLGFQGNSNYNALQMKLERRMAKGLAVLISYTAAKSIGDANPSVTFLSDNSGSYQNNWNRRLERTLLPWDISQRAVITTSYVLPVGRGKRFGAKWGRKLDALIGGWQTNALITRQVGSPLPLSLTSASTYGGTRPNSEGYTANLNPDERTRDRWFNTTAFTRPPAYSLGNTSRTLPDVRGPSVTNVDCSLFKTVSFTDKWRLQIRGEAFNVLNHTNFNNPNASFGSANFGLITSARSPRRSQIALKLNF